MANLIGSSQNDCMNCKGGNDKISGLAGNDKLNRTDGKDLLRGSNGDDKIVDFSQSQGDIKANDCE